MPDLFESLLDQDASPFGEDLPRPPSTKDPSAGRDGGISIDRHVNGRADGKTATVSHTTRARAYMEKLGYTFAIVEAKNPFTGMKSDAFGLFDFLALNQDEIVGVQVCSESGWTAHLAKMTQDNPAVKEHRDRSTGKLRLDNSRLWLAHPSRRILILSYEQQLVGRRNLWIAAEHWVTETELALSIGRRRK